MRFDFDALCRDDRPAIDARREAAAVTPIPVEHLIPVEVTAEDVRRNRPAFWDTLRLELA